MKHRTAAGRTVSATLLATTMLAFGLPGIAQAQTADQSIPETPEEAVDEAEVDSTIVVTGTLVRGIDPVGTTVVGFDAEEVIESGATSTIELLADVPEVSNFFNQVNVPTTNFGDPADRPQIRGLPTLVMLNGYRIVGTGLIQTAPEPNQIAPGSIGRVEVIPGSGSSIYGSDAIGGVINFITRRDYDGVELAGRYGFGDDFDSVDAQVSAGQSWGSGSILLSYGYAHHGRIKYKDRRYYSEDLTQFGGGDFRGTACPDPTITVGGVDYQVDGTPGASYCDRNLNADFYPEETRHNAFLGIDQDITPALTMNVAAYYSQRRTYIETAAFSTTLTITDANPFFQPIGDETSQTINLAYDPVFGPALENQGIFDSYGITPEFTYSLNNGWRIKLGGNYGHSDNFNSAAAINAGAQTAAINGTTLDTALNPYDLTQTNPAVLAAIANSRTIAETDQNLYQARLVADGPLFQISGNDVQLAAGVEYLKNDVSPTLTQGPVPGGVVTSSSGSRNVKSVFGELVVPLFTPENGVGGLNELVVSASARYDKYSDFGDTFNPKLALTYAPFEGLRFLANWGTNFNAPSLTDTTVTVDTRNQLIAGSPWQRPTDDFLTNIGRPTILIAGGNPDLQPQTSTNWSVGFELEPGFASGLSIGADYYNIKFRDRIFLVLPFLPPSNITNPALSDYFIFNPTLEQARAALAGRRNDGFVNVEDLYAGDPSSYPYLINDARRANLGAENREGIDARLDYEGDFGNVGFEFGVNLNYQLKRESQQIPGTPFVDQLENGFGALAMSGYLGMDVGALNARLSHFRSGGYPISGVAPQTDIDAFDTTNLYLGLDMGFTGLDETTLSLNIENLFDTIPPFINRGANQGRINGSTLGRVVTLGLRTAF